MSIFDWLGPLGFGAKQQGWAALPAPRVEVKTAPGPMLAAGPTAFWTPTSAVSLFAPQDDASNSAVFACLQAIAVAVAEPEVRVYRLAPGERVEQERTPLGDLLARPNPHMTLDMLLSYAAVCLHVDGNAYWRKLRAGDALTGNVVELWPISPSRMEVVTRNGSSDFISLYRYTGANGRTEDIPPENVVHFRYGLDDADHRLGLAPLKRLCREISSDQQATRYADRLLANLAINGLSLSFDKDAPGISQAQADELKARVSAAYGGDNVGSTAVLSPGATLSALGFSPEQMDLKVLHRVPEERISAALGVPAIVAGLGAGLDRSTYSNFSEAREAFTETKLLPLWRSLAATLTLHLVPDFTSDSSVVVDFDTDDVRALAGDLNAEAVRLKTLVEAGILSTDEARAEIGYEPAAPSPTPAALPSVAARRAVRALPLVTKAAEDLPGQYEAMRAADLPAWEAELIGFLAQQERRVLRRLAAGADTAEALVTEGEAVLLGETLTPLQLRVLGQVSRLVVAELGIAFELDDAASRRFLADAGGNIGGITETTRSAVQLALAEGQARGEGIPQLAARLMGLPAFDRARGRVVGRTELGTSQNQAALASYRASGVVVGVRVLDGHDFDAGCAAMDGRTFPLDAPPAALEHPNCTRALSPVLDAAEMTRSA